MPEWNDVHVPEFNIIFYNKAVFNILNLFLFFVLSPDFKRDVIDQEIGCGGCNNISNDSGLIKKECFPDIPDIRVLVCQILN